MILEDHLGDIIRKARTAADISLEAAARAAGLSEDALHLLEQSGTADTRPDLGALAKLIGLHPAKLEGIANGWLPQEPDLSQWRELRKITTSQNGITVNCYLVWDEVTREAALFDTGWEAQSIFQLVTENELQLKHLFLTHTHEDHVAAMAAIREKFPKAHLHTSSKSAPPQHRNRANDFIHLGSLRITNRATPGHAEDGVTYVIGNWPEDAPHVAIVGDTLFAGSLATGFQSTELLKQNVREQIFSLPPETLIAAGHGPFTTVKQEKEHNPFFS
jgi:glyoxylase-like metal-dependent hydrolase (beta-lactamase superfamily II)